MESNNRISTQMLWSLLTFSARYCLATVCLLKALYVKCNSLQRDYTRLKQTNVLNSKGGFRGPIGAMAPLKPTKETLFTVVLYNS